MDPAGGDRRGRDSQNRRVGHLHDGEPHGGAHGPAAVVVGVEPGIGIALLLEQILGQPTVGLVPLDHIGPGGIADRVDLECLGGDPNGR